jgi:hypothetical protein
MLCSNGFHSIMPQLEMPQVRQPQVRVLQGPSSYDVGTPSCMPCKVRVGTTNHARKGAGQQRRNARRPATTVQYFLIRPSTSTSFLFHRFTITVRSLDLRRKTVEPLILRFSRRLLSPLPTFGPRRSDLAARARHQDSPRIQCLASSRY